MAGTKRKRDVKMGSGEVARRTSSRLQGIVADSAQIEAPRRVFSPLNRVIADSPEVDQQKAKDKEAKLEQQQQLEGFKHVSDDTNATEALIDVEPRVKGMITVTAGEGEDADTFQVHEHLLKKSSVRSRLVIHLRKTRTYQLQGFFQAALSKQWKEGQEQKIDLPDDDPHAVAVYINWLYTSDLEIWIRILPFHPQLSSGSVYDGGHNSERMEMLAGLYVFGDKIQDRVFTNAVIVLWTRILDRIEAVDRTDMCPSISCVRLIYEGTIANSPARRLLVHIYTMYRDWLDEERREGLMACPEFMWDLYWMRKLLLDDVGHHSLYAARSNWMQEL